MAAGLVEIEDDLALFRTKDAFGTDWERSAGQSGCGETIDIGFGANDFVIHICVQFTSFLPFVNDLFYTISQ